MNCSIKNGWAEYRMFVAPVAMLSGARHLLANFAPSSRTLRLFIVTAKNAKETLGAQTVMVRSMDLKGL